MIIFPSYQLVTPDGAEFDAFLIPVSGGSLRSERWRARFDMAAPQGFGDAMTDTRELAARYVDVALSEMSFVIENPDHRSGQPRRVVVQLR
jgi:hypothetical protein